MVISPAVNFYRKYEKNFLIHSENFFERIIAIIHVDTFFNIVTEYFKNK